MLKHFYLLAQFYWPIKFPQRSDPPDASSYATGGEQLAKEVKQLERNAPYVAPQVLFTSGGALAYKKIAHVVCSSAQKEHQDNAAIDLYYATRVALQTIADGSIALGVHSITFTPLFLPFVSHFIYSICNAFISLSSKVPFSSRY